MALKLLSLYICILYLASGIALGSSIQLRSPSFPNQFIRKSDIQYSQLLSENSKLDQTSIFEEKEIVPIIEKESPPAPEETKSGFFGSVWSYAQQGFNSAKEKFKKVPNALTRQASVIGNKAKNLPTVLTQEISKAGKRINNLGRKVSDLVSKPSQPNVPEQARNNENSTETEKASSKEEIQAEQIRLLQKKVKETPSGLESSFSSVKSIPKSVSNTLQAVANKAKKSTKDIANGASVIGRKLGQLPQNLTRAFEGTLKLWKNLVSGGINKVGSKIQSVPATLSGFSQNLTRNFNQTRLIQTKNMWAQKIKGIPERVSKAFSFMGNQIKRMVPANISFSEGFNKIKQKVNATSFSKAINTFTSKLTNVPVRMQKTISFVLQGMKQRISSLAASVTQFANQKLPSLSEGAEYMMNSVGRLTSSVGSIFSWTKNSVLGLIFGTFRQIMKLWSWISSLKTILYWVLGAILAVVFVYFMSQALPIINFIIQIIRTPLDVLSLILAIFKSILPSKKSNLSKEEKEILEKFKKNKAPKKVLNKEETIIPSQKNKDHLQYYSYYRCNDCEKEWESPNTAKDESQKCTNDDCIKTIKPYHQIPLLSKKDKPSPREVYFSYYNCPSCQEKWESPKTFENEPQECKNSECSQEVLPYHQIQLLNSHQKVDKEKNHSKK